MAHYRPLCASILDFCSGHRWLHVGYMICKCVFFTFVVLRLLLCRGLDGEVARRCSGTSASFRLTSSEFATGNAVKLSTLLDVHVSSDTPVFRIDDRQIYMG